jgi:hypothetical protein
LSSKEEGVKKYFFSSSACAYNKTKQQEVFIEGLKRMMHTLQIQKMAMVGKNYLAKECAGILWKITVLK